jgi:tetrahydrodipicolinate N-succinyltransferase
VTLGSEFALPVRIKKGVWVGAGAIILPGVTVGCRAVGLFVKLNKLFYKKMDIKTLG